MSSTELMISRLTARPEHIGNNRVAEHKMLMPWITDLEGRLFQQSINLSELSSPMGGGGGERGRSPPTDGKRRKTRWSDSDALPQGAPDVAHRCELRTCSVASPAYGFPLPCLFFFFFFFSNTAATHNSQRVLSRLTGCFFCCVKDGEACACFERQPL